MQVSEAQRRALYEQLRERLGEETATLVMEVTVPANVDLATRGDIQELRAEMLLRFVDLEQRFVAFEQRFVAFEQHFGVLEQRVTSFEANIDRMLTGKLYRVVIPVLVAANGVIVGLATWIGTLAG
jgi:hypothetical protein